MTPLSVVGSGSFATLVFIGDRGGVGVRSEMLLAILSFPVRLHRLGCLIEPRSVSCDCFKFGGAEPFDPIWCRTAERLQ